MNSASAAIPHGFAAPAFCLIHGEIISVRNVLSPQYHKPAKNTINSMEASPMNRINV